MRQIGLVLLGLLLFACFVPVFSMLVIFPVTILFGDNEGLFRAELTLTYLLAAATAIWIIRRMWTPKPPARNS